MLRTALRHTSRHGFAGQWVKSGYACYSALSSSVKITSIPAPHSGSITVLSLNRPQARNALSRQLLGELSDVVEGLHREGGKGTTRALILASEVDNAFCAGADLKERVGMSQEE
jgi:methylglutaconyl-CoA hydratase